jgi:hypothetical protein
MRSITFKVVGNSERHRAIQKTRNRWDDIADLIKNDKTVFISAKYCSVIRTALASRGVKKITASKRDNGYVVWSKQPVVQFEVISEPVAEMELVHAATPVARPTWYTTLPEEALKS